MEEKEKKIIECEGDWDESMDWPDPTVDEDAECRGDNCDKVDEAFDWKADDGIGDGVDKADWDVDDRDGRGRAAFEGDRSDFVIYGENSEWKLIKAVHVRCRPSFVKAQIERMLKEYPDVDHVFVSKFDDKTGRLEPADQYSADRPGHEDAIEREIDDEGEEDKAGAEE